MSSNNIKIDPKFDYAFFQQVSNYAGEILKKIETGEISPKIVEVEQPSKVLIGLGIAISTVISGTLIWKRIKPNAKILDRKKAEKLEPFDKETQT